VRFALEVHPTEIAYDFPTTHKAIDAIGRRDGFGINFDPSHFAHQFLDPAAFVEEFADRIYHAHVKDSRKRLDGRRSILGSHVDFGEPERGWTFVSPGHGDVDFEDVFRALNRIGYSGPLSIEWEDSGMDRDWARPTRWLSCAAPISRRRRWPSTPPSSAPSRVSVSREERYV
jgi:sugar phosphate isomerase/epimerase